MTDMTRLDPILEKLYGPDQTRIEKEKQRYRQLDADFLQQFGDQARHYFSTPGRTEIGGNHTDHNHGRVLAASVDLDSIAVVAATPDQQVEFYSEGYPKPFQVDLSDLAVQKNELGTTAALIRGIAARLKVLGYTVGGFYGCMTSSVLPGSGLSSSASVEILIGTIFNALYNDNRIPAETLALVGQFAENYYFGKPCGLMDQMTCAVGGIITIDFNEPQEPVFKKVAFDFNQQNYSLLVVDSGGNHADLTADYAAIPAEMKAVASHLGAPVLRPVTWDMFQKALPQLRTSVGDRAVLRALHFLNENERVRAQVQALESGDFQKFLALITESGNSSFKWLQNIYTTQNIKEQGVTVALALTEHYLGSIRAGACRVHGGGFAGTIQVFLPNAAVAAYVRFMASMLGPDRVLVLKIRPVGTMHLNAQLAADV